MFHKSNFFVITGGPGVGKTSVIRELSNRGYVCMEEDARRIIREQQAKKGDALPWKDKRSYTMHMLQSAIDSYSKASTLSDGPIFFDRGILDAIGYAALECIALKESYIQLARQYVYNPIVFFFSPWRDIYETDQERKQSWQEACATSDMLFATYKNFGYTPIEVPMGSIAQRVEFILTQI
ncbi:AAA family ATPase [Sphingobacterium suaedae]|uniref:AAA family ATPase n=1 Tax=Sphingobacterium suaedae TaxID=1686402 RepID=A0ABW5KGJ8_9SPHI